jgi:hypothetical protein
MPDPQLVGKREQKTIPRLVFPTDLSRVGPRSVDDVPNIPYIEFTAYKWHVDANQKRNASIFIQSTGSGSVVLPLAETINDQQNINWETAEGVGAKNIFEFGLKRGLDTLRALSTNIAAFVEVKKGRTINDLQSLAFGLTDLRNWNFTFKLMPKGQRDSQRLAEVIQFFKQNAIADFIGNLIEYPSFFTVKVHFPTGDSGSLFERLLIFKTSVITNLNVQYTPEGQSFYRDGAPTQVTIDLTMKELERPNKKEYNLGLT